MGGCQTKNFKTGAQYFNTDLDSHSYSWVSLGIHSVKLEPKIKNIRGNQNCQVELIKYLDSSRTSPKSGGQTESGVADSSNTINFEKFFILEYFFEKDQPIEFRITGSINGSVKTSLPSIMSSRGLTLNMPIEGTDGAILQIKGFSYKSKATTTLKFDTSINGNLFGKGFVYSIKAKGNTNNPLNKLLYKSEIISPPKNVKKIRFKICSIPDIYISNDEDYNTSLVEIEFYDAKHKKKVGEYNDNLKSLINKKTDIKLGSFGTGTISVDAIKKYSFLDYLRGGMQINLNLAIDFTGSNGVPNIPNSLHYLGPNANLYETAIRACGDIISYYNYDQKIPAFGFGGKFYGNPEVDHCFPLNCNQNNPEICGIDGVLQTYRTVLNNTILFGPTFFHFIIDKLNEKVKEDMDRGNYNNYNILMILTDGVIDDMDETINSLVESSYLPISVIIIGIGDADFSNMDIFNADDDHLIDVNGRKIDREFIQFVSYKDLQNDGRKLAEQVLEEIPKQIVEFYQYKKISPGDPVVNLQNQM